VLNPQTVLTWSFFRAHESLVKAASSGQITPEAMPLQARVVQHLIQYDSRESISPALIPGDFEGGVHRRHNQIPYRDLHLLDWRLCCHK
jgi:hypothetical protein